MGACVNCALIEEATTLVASLSASYKVVMSLFGLPTFIHPCCLRYIHNNDAVFPRFLNARYAQLLDALSRSRTTVTTLSRERKGAPVLGEMEVQERLHCRRLEKDAIEAVGDELKVKEAS
jgi:hypothetical protein